LTALRATTAVVAVVVAAVVVATVEAMEIDGGRYLPHEF